MRKNRSFKNNSRRRMLLKKLHQRVLLRRKQHSLIGETTELQEAC